MKIEDNRNLNVGNIGDIIITDKGNKYILLINDGIDADRPIAVCNIEKDYIEYTIENGKLYIGDSFSNDEIIIEIIPKSKIKIVIK
jgi:hypothetical protein